MVDTHGGWSAGCVTRWSMRTFLPVCAAAVNTAKRNCSLLTACEQEKVNRMPPGAIFSKARALKAPVTAQGALQGAAVLGKCRRVEYYKVVGAVFHTFEVFKSVHRM